jgi:NAD(P)-dependent dehydrogenase (short-subunit alcohol dehydrogenase family)
MKIDLEAKNMNRNQSRPRSPVVTVALIAATTIFISSACNAQTDSSAEESKEPLAPTVLITGANRGLGLELARQYSAAGWQVIGTARSPAEADELQQTGVQVLQLDVTNQESVDRLANELRNRPIDMLINNAGILPMMSKIPDINFDVVNQILAVNTLGPMRVTQALLPNLKRGKVKKIVNITSNLGSIDENTDGGFYGYRESKAALNMFTRTLAAELRPAGFICIVLNPGWVQTDMGGPSAPLQPPESVQGMRKVIDKLAPDDNGTFWSHDGTQMAW